MPKVSDVPVKSLVCNPAHTPRGLYYFADFVRQGVVYDMCITFVERGQRFVDNYSNRYLSVVT